MWRSPCAEKDIRKRVPYILGLVGLSQKARCMPNELSGGEQQRVSLARALVNNPDLIVADEPTGNVDPEMSREIVDMLTKINNDGKTVVMVTHNHNLVKRYQRRVIVIQNGQVVSDTPDPLNAHFSAPVKEPRQQTENTSLNDKSLEDVFDNLEDVVEQPSGSEDGNGGDRQ